MTGAQLYLIVGLRVSGIVEHEDSICALQLDTVHLQQLPVKEGPTPCRAVDFIVGRLDCESEKAAGFLKQANIQITQSAVPIVPTIFEYKLYKRGWPFRSGLARSARYKRMVKHLSGNRFQFKLLEAGHKSDYDIVMAYCLEVGQYEVTLMSQELDASGRNRALARGVLVVIND